MRSTSADARSSKSDRPLFLFALVCSAFVALVSLCQVAHAARAEGKLSLESTADQRLVDCAPSRADSASLLVLSREGLLEYELAVADLEDSDQDASMRPDGVSVAGRAASVASSVGKGNAVWLRVHVPRQLGSPELARAPPAG